MMIEHTILARSNTILSDQNASLLGYNIMEEGLVKFLLDQDYRYVLLLAHMITYIVANVVVHFMIQVLVRSTLRAYS